MPIRSDKPFQAPNETQRLQQEGLELLVKSYCRGLTVDFLRSQTQELAELRRARGCAILKTGMEFDLSDS